MGGARRRSRRGEGGKGKREEEAKDRANRWSARGEEEFFFFFFWCLAPRARAELTRRVAWLGGGWVALRCCVLGQVAVGRRATRLVSFGCGVCGRHVPGAWKIHTPIAAASLFPFPLFFFGFFFFFFWKCIRVRSEVESLALTIPTRFNLYASRVIARDKNTKYILYSLFFF